MASKKFYGKRMVPEYLITKLETLEPSTEYTAGTGIDINEDEISIDDEVVATKTDLEDYELKSEAFSGSYNDLIDKPTIPAAQVQSDWSQSDNTQVDYIKNKPTIPDTTNMVTTNTTQTISGDKEFTGSTSINTLMTADDHIGMGYDNMNDNVGITIYDINGNPSSAIGRDSNNVLYFNGPSGVSIYNGLNKTFNIPSKADGTYTLATTDDIPTVPTKTSDLQNDSGFITSSDIPAQVQANWNESDNTSKAYIQNKPSIPTTATSNSTVTPSTIQLTFTYSDNTTETITLMTGASVSTTTTLS